VKGDIKKAAEALHVERAALAAAEAPVEAAVSAYLGRLPFLWLSIEDEPTGVLAWTYRTERDGTRERPSQAGH
jgi:hypothetical protein